MTRMSNPPSADELPGGIERSQDLQLLGVRRRRGLHALGHQQFERRPGAHLVDAHAGVERLEPHPAAGGLEAEEAERGDDARDAAEEQAAARPRVAARQVPRARDEVDLLDEAPRLVSGQDDHRLMVAELTRAHDGQELVGADARRGVAHGVSSRARSRAAASAASPKSARYSAWVAGP